MDNTNFCFWFQGFFEILDAENLKLTEKQIKCVEAHLNLAREVDGKLDEFQAWLLGFLDGKHELNIEETYKIKVGLASHFEHVIDPKFEGKSTATKLQKLHDAFKLQPSSDPNTTVYRC